MVRRALLIGINEYQNVRRLRGCGNDVFNLSGVLRELAGFDLDEVRVLAHDRATRQRIEDRIDWLVSDARPGDLLVLHFSGHGSQVRDVNGNELRDDLDEILCPYDMDWNGTFITDDYLQGKLQVPDGVVLEVILDACHSGQGSEPGEPVVASSSSFDMDPDRISRFVEPPPDILNRHAGQDLSLKRLFRRAPAAGHLVLWSACGESQTAADARINGVFNGAFSFFFCEHLRRTNGNLTRLELLERVKASLAEAGFTQVPELSAPESLLHARPFSLDP